MGIANAHGYGSQRFHQPAGGRRHAAAADRRNQVCFHWKAGSCSRRPCPFLHCELDGTKEEDAPHPSTGSRVWRNPNAATGGRRWGAIAAPRPQPKHRLEPEPQRPPTEEKDKKALCKYFAAGKDCSLGEKCAYLHSWFVGDGSFSLLVSLQGHQEAITGIALPKGSDRLYSASQDGTIRAWDCNTGQCIGAINVGGKVGCMICEEKGQWIFVGIPDSVKACNARTSAIVTLDGPIGQVNALAVDHHTDGDGLNLYAGTQSQDGRILAWKLTGDRFEPTDPLTGHRRAVVCLEVGRGGRMYSGSMDSTIRVWDLASSQCLLTLSAHTDAVMSVLCWNEFLLSGSLDGTVKAWAVKMDGGDMHAVHSRDEEHGVLGLSGLPDAQGRPVLSCACNDDSVRLYNLPSFGERGRLLAKEGVRAASSGPGGLFFTRDGAGISRCGSGQPRRCRPPLHDHVHRVN